jgi:hypothetical protein
VGTEGIDLEELSQQFVGAPFDHPKEGDALRGTEQLPPIAPTDEVSDCDRGGLTILLCRPLKTSRATYPSHWSVIGEGGDLK